jgi:hypothetical protein
VGKHNHAPLPIEFGEVRTRIQSRRASKKAGSAMPEELWKEAASWTSGYGIHRVCKALGLSQTRMNQFLEPRRPMELRQVPTPVRPTFVELSLDPGARMRAQGGGGDSFTGGGTAQVGPVVEVTSRDGGRLVMRLTPGSPVDAIGLLQCFLGRRA